nr:MAG: NfeD-like protein [Thermoproteus sp. AZ2]
MNFSLLFIVIAFSQPIYYIKNVYIIKIDNTIGPYTVSQISRAVSEAESSSGAVLLLLDTPGGLADSTLEAMHIIGSSPAPVIGFVYPDYGYAWSGGTYLLLSTQIAAMAPHTVIGSCQPIEGSTPVNYSKVLNAFATYLATAMASYGRNASYAYLCVEQNLNLNAEEALRYHVINYVATDVQQLLSEINGSYVELRGSKTLLIVQSPSLIYVQPTFGEALQAWLMNPIVQGVLSLLALLIIIIAVATAHPLAASIGVALFIFSALPYISTGWVWVLLFAMGVVLLFMGLLTGGATHGILEGGGVVLIGLGFLSLFPTFQLQGQPIVIQEYWPLVAGASAAVAVLAGLVALILWKAIAVHIRRPVSEPLLTLRGLEGTAIEDIRPGGAGYIVVLGEYWRATAKTYIKRGCRVRVVDPGPPLVVEPIDCA